jgi:O-antigen/teichoic acid export membrane protein
MGIVQRQSLKYTAINLLGVALGVVSTLFIYPLITAEFGFIRYLQELSLLVLPLISFGMPLTAIRFFPEFKDPHQNDHGLLGLALLTACCSILITVVLGLMAWPYLVSLAKSDLKHGDLLWLVFPFAILTTLSTILYNYSQNTHRIAFSSLLSDVLPKFIIPIILLCFWKGWISFEVVLYLILGQLVFSIVGLAVFLKRLGVWHIRIDKQFLTAERLKRFFGYAGFVTAFGLAFILATRMDVIFLGSMTSFATTGVYAIVVFMVSTIEIPTRGLYMASYAKIPALWLTKDIRELETLLRKSGVSLITVGSAILALLILNIGDLVQIMPNGQIMGGALPMIILLGLAKLADAVGGVSMAILYFSDRYRWSMVSLAILAILNISLSFWLIPKHGTLGAAFVTAGSVIAFNAFSLVYCVVVWDIKPPIKSILLCLAVAVGSLTLAWLMPNLENPFINMGVKSSLFLSIYVWAIYTWQLAPDLIQMVTGWLKKTS